MPLKGEFFMLQIILLVIAVCIDAFAVSLTYGMGNIKIPVFSALIISAVGTVFLSVSVFLASLVASAIDKKTCIVLSMSLLILLGVINIFQNSIKAYLRRHKGKKNVSFSLFDISFVVEIFFDETKADWDNSKSLSAKEALVLAIPLSIDSLASGFSAGLGMTSLWGIVILSFIAGLLLILLGSFIGRRISRKTKLNLSWISGVALIILGLTRLL